MLLLLLPLLLAQPCSAILLPPSPSQLAVHQEDPTLACLHRQQQQQQMAA
jgi:hypothetical protein